MRFLFMFSYVSVWEYVQRDDCRCTQRPEALYWIRGGHEPLRSGNPTWAFCKAVHVLSSWAISRPNLFPIRWKVRTNSQGCRPLISSCEHGSYTQEPWPPHSHFLSPPPSCPHHGLRRDQTTDIVPWVLCWRHTVHEKPHLWIYPGYQDILISPFGVRDIMKESLCQKHSWIPGWSRKYQL